jgi:hypothetical protein
MRHAACSMDRTSGGTTSPWHYTITWGIYCLQRWALLEARLSSKPASGWHTHPVPHPSSSLQQHLSTCLSTSSDSTHNFGQWRKQGALRSLGQGQNSPSPLWKNLVKLILYYRAQWSIFGNSPFNQISNPEYSPMWPLKELPNLQKYFGIVMQKTIYSGLSFSFFSLSVYDIWVNIITGDIYVSLQNLFYTSITQYQHFKHALFFPCNAFLIFSNFSLLLNLIYMHRYIQNMDYVPCNLFHKLFNLALHCLYLCHQNVMLALHCLNSDPIMYISSNCSILNLYSVPLSWGRMYDKSSFINSPPSPLPLPSPHVASKGTKGTLNPPTPSTPSTPLPSWE